MNEIITCWNAVFINNISKSLVPVAIYFVSAFPLPFLPYMMACSLSYDQSSDIVPLLSPTITFNHEYDPELVRLFL